MAITDLTNTTWVIKDTISLDYDSYNINFTSNNTQYTTFEPRYGNSMVSWVYYGNDMVCTFSSSTGECTWENTAYKTIEITGGTDVTNADLISLLEDNATQQVSGGSLSLGTLPIDKMFVGSSEVQSVWVGDKKVYEKQASALSLTITFSNSANPYYFVSINIYDDYTLSNDVVDISSSDYVGSISSANGTTTVSVETGKFAILCECSNIFGYCPPVENMVATGGVTPTGSRGTYTESGTLINFTDIKLDNVSLFFTRYFLIVGTISANGTITISGVDWDD